MSDFVFITDTHFTSSSRVRSGDVVEDLMKKLRFVVDYCNKYNCILLHGGDFCDRPSVPDFVKSQIFQELRRLETKMYSIFGNHDLLYNNEEFLFKTSYETVVSAGLMEPLDSIECVDLGDVIISAKVPIISRGKPQIFLGHMFLNVEDGRNTFRFTDIQTEDPCYICLGHDHVVYEPIEFKPGIKIFRPGSFLRGARQDTNKRIPQLLHIRVREGKLYHKLVDISTARPWEEVFKPKELKITKAQQADTYDEIIAQIRNAQKSDISFKQALEQVAEPDVVAYCMETLQEVQQEKNFKKL